MTTATPLLLITKDPSHPLAELALRYARAFVEQTAEVGTSNQTQISDSSEVACAPLKLFFYADAAHIANRLRWQSADQANLTQQWQALAQRYKLPLAVCVSTALSRGVSDSDNSARHQLQGDNVAQGFDLVGLSDLAMMMQSDCRLIQF